MQRYNNLELKTNFGATDFLGVFVSVWQIVLYDDISEINCCILTDFEENEGLWLRILEKRSFPVMVIFGQNENEIGQNGLYYNINIFIL